MKETTSEYLQNVLESYKLSHVDKLVNKYKKKREEVKELLESNFKNNIYNPINSGSFAKHTAINSTFDLDIAVPFKKNSFKTLATIFNEMFVFLEENYEDKASIRKQKVSIGIEFNPDIDGDIIKLDIVPGRELQEDQYPETKNMNLYVNSKVGVIEEKTYIQTNIQAQIDHIKAKENERRIIRLLKIWKTTQRNKYKSFFLELLTIKAYENENIKGNLWDQLKNVMTYIYNNIDNESFTLKDPGNSNNNVIDTLTLNDRQALASTMKLIIDKVEENPDYLELYFPQNRNNTRGTYEIKDSSTEKSIPPKTQRFGKN